MPSWSMPTSTFEMKRQKFREGGHWREWWKQEPTWNTTQFTRVPMVGSPSSRSPRPFPRHQTDNYLHSPSLWSIYWRQWSKRKQVVSNDEMLSLIDTGQRSSNVAAKCIDRVGICSLITSCVTWGKLLNVSVLRVLICKMGLVMEPTQQSCWVDSNIVVRRATCYS